MNESLRFQRPTLLGLWRMLGWRGALAAAVGVALVIALLVAAAGLFLLLVPVFVLAAVVARLMLGGSARVPAAPRPTAPSGTIEGRYEVVDGPDQAPTGEGWGPRDR